jgi:ribosomal protein L40E
MTGLMPRIRRRRAERPEGTEAHPAEVPPVEAPPSGPAGTEPEDPAAPPAPGFRSRGRMRRRLRFLRRVRELGFRDLGGLVFDQHRFGRPDDELVRGKLAALGAIDAELRALQTALDDRRPITELREPGVAACPRCGALHGTDARFCPSCGSPLRGPRAMAGVGESVSLGVGEIGALSPASPSLADAPAATPFAQRVTSYATGSGPEAAADGPAADDQLPAGASAAGATRPEAEAEEADAESAPGAAEQATTATPPAGGESPGP